MESGEPSRNARRARVEELAVRLYATRRHYLLRIARANTASPEDAEDALHEALISFVRAFDPGGKAHPLAWLTLTLKRACWEQHRRHRFERRAGQELAPDEQGPGVRLDLIPDGRRLPEQWAELREEIAKARDHLAELKHDERRALSLLGLGYSYREIGRITGWTHTKINRCIAEGRARLRELRGQPAPDKPSQPKRRG